MSIQVIGAGLGRTGTLWLKAADRAHEHIATVSRLEKL
jgi:hypothetical protein